jgi:hypothetical protein
MVLGEIKEPIKLLELEVSTRTWGGGNKWKELQKGHARLKCKNKKVLEALELGQWSRSGERRK